MERTQQQWKAVQDQLERLKKQNLQLKQLLKIQMSKSHSSLEKKRQFQSYKQGQNLFHQQKQILKDTQQLKKQWAEWSNRLEASLLVKNNKLRHKTQFDDLRKTSNLNGSTGSDGFHHIRSIESSKSKIQQQIPNIKIQSLQEIQEPKKLKIIEGVFLFGPNVSEIQQSQQRKFGTRHQLYYPQQKKQQFQIYGNYLYPNELLVKNIRPKNHAVEMNTMIFKNSKKQQCNVFIFQGQHNPSLKQKNQLIQRINPSKWLYAISIQFSDFLALQDHKIQDKISRTYSLLIQKSHNDKFAQGQMQSRDVQLERSSKKVIPKDPAVFKSTFCLCIMTYFPFIRFLKQILIQIFDSIKVKRMKILQQSTSAKQIDIYSFIYELKGQISRYISDKLQFQPKINGIYDIQFYQHKPQLNLKEEYLMYQLTGDWAFKILRTIDKDSLYDIFLYTMMQESICFVCQDSHLLTFVMLFFISILSLPFGYPHPCISIVFNDQLLETPFTAILGINKNNKWLQQNIDFLIQDKQNKVIVSLNDEEIKIKCKKKIKLPKSQKLKKIFNNFYKKIQTSAIPSIFKKKMDFNTRQTTKQENDFVISMFAELNQFYIQEIFMNMPNKQIIQYIRQSCDQTNNHTEISNKLTQKIQTYLHESRKRKEKDHFIEALLERQLFYIYLARTYDIQ